MPPRQWTWAPAKPSRVPKSLKELVSARAADLIEKCIKPGNLRPRWEWLEGAANKRLLEELGKLEVQVNQEKTRMVDLMAGESFSFLGFDFRRIRTRRGKWGVRVTPRMTARTALLRKLKEVFRRFNSQPVDRVIDLINPVLRGWANYFRIGNSSQCFGYIKDWVEKKIRRHLMRAKKRHGFGWNRWSRAWFYKTLGLFNDYRVQHCRA